MLAGRAGGDAEASAAGFPVRCVEAPARIGVRHPGGQVGNRNRWVHGRRSAAAVKRRKAGAAGRKAAGLILARLGSSARVRCRLVRLDQLQHLGVEALAMLTRLGVTLPG